MVRQSSVAHAKREVIEIKPDALRTVRRRLFNRKIDALVTFSPTASPILGNFARLSAPDQDPADFYENERRKSRDESDTELSRLGHE
jgi:hypothetical protein